MPNYASDVAPGDRFGHLSVLGPPVMGDIGNYLPCICDCKRPVFILWSRLSAGAATSCGCNTGNRTHGFRRTRLYSIWSNMKSRCYNSALASFPNYGGRGIFVCDEWRTDFSAFKDWALQNGYTDAGTLERVDVNGNYEPSNCTWIPMQAQAGNRRSSIVIEYASETKILKEWAKDPRCAVGYHTLYARIKNGWNMASAMTTPAQGKGVSTPECL